MHNSHYFVPLLVALILKHINFHTIEHMEEIYLLIMKKKLKLYKYGELLNSLNKSLVPFACVQNRVPVCLSYVFLVFGRLDGLLEREMIFFCVN